MRLTKIAAIFACVTPLIFAAEEGRTQSSPGFTYGQVPTAGQWNSYFAAKQDVLGYTPLNQAGGTMLGPLNTAPSTTSTAGFSVLPGVGPNLPNNGDIWMTSSGLYYQAGNMTFGPIGAGTINGPITTVVGNVAKWGNTTGTLLTDGGALGTAATQNTGTSGATIPLLNGANTWSAAQAFSSLTSSAAIPVSSGGTGAAILTSNGVLLGNGTSALSASAAMTNGQLLVGQTSAAPLPKTISGDATVAASGAVTVNSINGNPTGVAANNIVKLNASAQLPAVDGSLLTGVVASGGLVNVQAFTTAGSFTYTRSSGATKGTVITIGGGAAGGGAPATGASQISIGSGGGGGGLCIAFNVSLPASASGFVGGPGVGVVGGTGGTAGDSLFNSTFVAHGGSGGVPIGPNSGAFVAPGGAGGAACTTGTINGVGAPGTLASNGASTGTVAGSGGQGPMFGGPGTGGAGAAIGPSTAAAAGSNGTAGAVVIYEYR